MPSFVDAPQAIAKAMMLWREYDHPPPFDMAWRLMRMRIAHTFGWTLAQVDELPPSTLAELMGYLMGISGIF